MRPRPRLGVGLRVAAALAALAVALPAAADAQTSLATRLHRALASPGVSWSATGVVAINLERNAVVYRRNGSLPLRPASNEKLAVAVAALDELGSDFRIETAVLGEGVLDGTTWRGRLVLKGAGDPTLSWRDLARLANQVENAGIRSVTGAVVGDESYFDTRRTAPGWKPSFYKLECPPLSALIVARGRLGRRTVDNPALVAAQGLRGALRAAGVAVGRPARTGVAGAGAVELARVYSPRLSWLVGAMNRPSDNFYAETLMKVLGAEELGRGTTAAGARVVRRALAARRVPLAGVRIVDGSGLSRYDRMTANAVARLLVSAWRDPVLREPLVASLPVAGISGTLRDRMERPPARGVVRAKTGTTNNASALSGYVRTRYVFSILQNGYPIPWWHARRGQDRFAQVLAAS